MHRSVLAALVMILAPLLAGAQQLSTSAADAQKDPVLKAMLDELNRSRQQLHFQDMQKPFFIQYVVDDVDDYEAYVLYGSFSVDREQRRRLVRVTVRVGDYKMDSSSAKVPDGAVQYAALDNDPGALRYALWAATDTAYKAALNAYTQKQAELKTVQTPPAAGDFSHENPVISIAPIAVLNFDRKLWIDRVSEATAAYSKDQLEEMNGHIAANSLNRYLVNTEGTIVRKGSSEYMAGVDAGTQAADGMRLERAYATVGASADQLDSAEQFSAGVQRIVDSLADLAKAPVIPAEYHGPVLFTGDASSDIFARLLSSPVAALRPDIGTTERTRGPYSSGYQTRVLPDFLKIVDDPALASFDGKALLGSYAVDDEGVPSQSVTLVDQGKLVNYLIGRQPVKDFAESNGHGRAGAGGPPHPAIAVLHIEAEKSVPDQALNQKLLTLGKDQGLDAVYEVETFGPSLTPRLLYKIDVATGKRELVRGAALADLDLRALRSEIRAAGDTTYVDNIFGNPASTILAPPLLIDDVTVKRAEQPNQKLPYYPPPD